jgi:hypothetical protein
VEEPAQVLSLIANRAKSRREGEVKDTPDTQKDTLRNYKFNMLRVEDTSKFTSASIKSFPSPKAYEITIPISAEETAQMSADSPQVIGRTALFLQNSLSCTVLIKILKKKFQKSQKFPVTSSQCDYNPRLWSMSLTTNSTTH